MLETASRRAASSRTIPLPSGWNRIFNCKCTAVILLFQGSIEFIVLMPIFFAASKAAALAHAPLFASRPGIRFALAMALLSSIVGDFSYYWVHRWQHWSRWGWPMHELHHEDEHMNVTTAYRFHWVESMVQNIVHILPAVFLPRAMVTIPLLYLAGCFRTLFEHLAIPIYLGPLNRLIANPANHRIHHSKLPEHFNKNFAAVWPFWDVIFGTYCAPKRGEYPPTGLVSGKVSKTVKDALWGPLQTEVRPSEQVTAPAFISEQPASSPRG